jgi:hypothetical protein
VELLQPPIPPVQREWFRHVDLRLRSDDLRGHPCRWEILPPGRLSLTYLESPGHSHLFFKGFTPDPHQNVRDLSYKLTEGVVSGGEDIVAMPFQFRWTLELSEPPWPSSLKLPYEAPRVFYGHRQSDKPRSGQSS